MSDGVRRRCSPDGAREGKPTDESEGLVSDQVIREDPAGAVVVRAWPGHRNIGRGSCRSAQGPPWRMKSNAGQQQWY